MKLEVGQQVYLVTRWKSDSFKNYYSTIEKVGKKFAYLKWQDRDVKLELKTWNVIDKKYGVVAKAYLDFDAYKQREKALSLQKFITDWLARTANIDEALSLEKLQKIKEILTDTDDQKKIKRSK